MLAPVRGGGDGLEDAVEDLDRRCRAVYSGLGGGAIELRGPPDPPFLRALGRALDLDGRYFATHGPAAGAEELTVIGEETDRVLGLASGFPSPWTARGVLAAIRGCVGDLDGVRVAVVGAGFVGLHLVALLLEAGADVIVADRVRAKAEATGARVVDPEEILGVPCDVLSPNARGALLTPHRVPLLRCRFVAGGANGQLAAPSVADLLGKRGIGLVPEEVAGSGWILNMAAELHEGGYDEERAAKLVDTIEELAREHLAGC